MIGGFGTQDLIATLVAVGALGYLVRRRLRRKAPGCDTCPRNAAVAGDGARPNVELISINRPPTEDRS